ncbi:MAG TPA: phosphonatase-like hydrolase, partial [Blastocatellia bacterium]|nr:phosphonatase-like hydrolase [Blastocatellia bacterium]
MRIEPLIELVVFDMAGTTVSEGGAVYQCLSDTLEANGLEIPANSMLEVKGMDKYEALRILIERSAMREQLLPGLDAIHEDFVERMIEFYRSNPEVGEMPGASETFRRLRQAGVKVALNTGFSRDIAQTLIDRLNWERDELIGASVTSDEVERGRPHPDMIQMLMLRLGVTDPRRVAKVGDTPADLFEGKNADCGLVVGVTQGSCAREQLEPCPHDHLIGSVAELPELL